MHTLGGVQDGETIVPWNEGTIEVLERRVEPPCLDTGHCGEWAWVMMLGLGG